MAIHKFFGALGQTTRYDGGPGPFLKHKHGCTWWRGTNYAQIAHNEAKRANQAYNGARNTLAAAKSKLNELRSLNSNAANPHTYVLNNLRNNLESVKNEVLREEPKQSFNCPDPGWYDQFTRQLSQIESQIRSKIREIDAALNKAKQEASQRQKEEQRRRRTERRRKEAERRRREREEARRKAEAQKRKAEEEVRRKAETARKKAQTPKPVPRPKAKKLPKPPGRTRCPHYTWASAYPPKWNNPAAAKRYLKRYPDVRKAVKRGIQPSALWHYRCYGKREGRQWGGWNGFGSIVRPGNLAGIFSNWDQID